MLEIEPTDHSGHTTTGSGGNKLDLKKFMISISLSQRQSFGYYETRIGDHGLPIICHSHWYRLITGKD